MGAEAYFDVCELAFVREGKCTDGNGTQSVTIVLERHESVIVLKIDRFSIDNFVNKKRACDPESNFIKKSNETRIFLNLRVCVVNEMALCSAFGIEINELMELDRGNIEKMITCSERMNRMTCLYKRLCEHHGEV